MVFVQFLKVYMHDQDRIGKLCQKCSYRSTTAPTYHPHLALETSQSARVCTCGLGCLTHAARQSVEHKRFESWPWGTVVGTTMPVSTWWWEMSEHAHANYTKWKKTTNSVLVWIWFCWWIDFPAPRATFPASTIKGAPSTAPSGIVKTTSRGMPGRHASCHSWRRCVDYITPKTKFWLANSYN